MKLVALILKNVGRNPLRSILTALGTMVLVFVVTMVWSVLWLLDLITTEKKENLKGIVTERWSIPSRMPFSYAASLSEGAARKPGDVRPDDSMTWQFYPGALDLKNLTRESMIFAIACDPDKLARIKDGKLVTMMDGLESLSPKDAAGLLEGIARLKASRQGIILGYNHLLNINKMIGDVRDTNVEKLIGKRIKLFGIGGYKGLDLEFDIVGAFPAGRYDNLGACNREYFNNALDQYPQTHAGRKHLMADRNLNLVWIKVPDLAAYNRVSAQIDESPTYSDPDVKCETASSGMAAFLEPLRDLIWGARYLLAPACLITLSLVIANAISISVRERRPELAVMKVLGFRPMQILWLVLGESLLLGAGAGFASAGLTYGVINWYFDGLRFPIGFFDRFFIPVDALWWGTAIGAIAALVGSFLPAWAARNVKPAEVFAKVA
jgi:putative ABC transport system permease protein